MSRPWTGGIAAGSRDFTPAEASKVVGALKKHTGARHATSLEAFSDAVSLPARTVRAILANFDGEQYVLHLQGDGTLYIAEFQDEAERTTRQLFSRANKLRARALRREKYAAALPRRQGYLFDFSADEDDEDLL